LDKGEMSVIVDPTMTRSAALKSTIPSSLLYTNSRICRFPKFQTVSQAQRKKAVNFLSDYMPVDKIETAWGLVENTGCVL
jgi:hypothetical protein